MISNHILILSYPMISSGANSQMGRLMRTWAAGELLLPWDFVIQTTMLAAEKNGYARAWQLFAQFCRQGAISTKQYTCLHWALNEAIVCLSAYASAVLAWIYMWYIEQPTSILADKIKQEKEHNITLVHINFIIPRNFSDMVQCLWFLSGDFYPQAAIFKFS